MSTKSRGTALGPDLKSLSIILLDLLILIHGAQAIDYVAYRTDVIPRGVTRESARTTCDILKELNLRKVSSSHDLQDGTEHLLQYGALLRTQILDTFGKLVYDHYDDFGMSQIEALYKIYRESLERKYNIFDIVPKILDDPDTRPTKICAHINERVRTCLKESSETCMNIEIHDEPHPAPVLEPALNVTRQIYRLAKIPRNYPNGFSLDAVLDHLRARRLRFTPALFSGLLHNIQYDSFDDRVRTAERELILLLNRSPSYFASKMTQKVSTSDVGVSQLLKNYLSDKEIFRGKASEHAAYLAQHVVREVDAVSENIELLGTVYDNATINLGYLFKLILPDDTIDRDVLEARDYLLRELVERSILENYLRVEKYQQAGPDQLLMEIFGQLRDIKFAEDVVTSLHAHAHFWHKSHMIENLNELLELFDAYENLRHLPTFAGLMEMTDRIKNNLRDSKNITVQLLCSRPRACLKSGLQIVLNCSIVNEETKSAIEEFVARTSCGCSTPIEDSQVIKKSTTHSRNRVEAMVTTKMPSAIGVKESVESTGDIGAKSTMISSAIMESVSTSMEISSSSSNYSDYDDDYDTDSEYNLSNEYDGKSSDEMQKKTVGTAEASVKNPEVAKCSGINCPTIGCIGADCPVQGNCTGVGCSEGENCKGLLCPDREIGKHNCSGSDCKLKAVGDCLDADCLVNSKVVRSDCAGLDCARNSTGIDCVGPNCSESSCVDNKCDVSSGSSFCEGDDCESSSCKGNDCDGKPAVGNSCVGRGCADDSIQCQGPDCPAAGCVGNDCKVNASLIVCKGLDCSESPIIENCEGADCLGTGDSCEGPDCSGNEEIKCRGDDCRAESAKIDCAGENCSDPASLGKIECEGRDCLEKVTACTGDECPMGTQKETCSGSDCLATSIKLEACDGANSETEKSDENCEGEDCFDTTSEEEVCEGLACSDTTSINVNCNGPNCDVGFSGINCEGSDCSVSDSELEADCKGTNCPKLKVGATCKGPDCPIVDAENVCVGPDCPFITEDSDVSCDGADCSINAEDNSENCNGSDCVESESDEIFLHQPKVIEKEIKLDCEGVDCPNTEVQGNCEGLDCPLVGAGLTINCTGADCPKLEGNGNCEGPQCPIIGEKITIDCTGADCPKSQVQGNCEGADCPLVGTGLIIDCTGADCPKLEGNGNCEGPQCPIIGEDITIDCKGADCPKSQVQGNCDGSDCPIVGAGLTIDCEGADCLKLEGTGNCEGPQCPIVAEEITIDCKGADCPESQVQENCEGSDCPIVGAGLTNDCEGPDCPQLKGKGNCEGSDCPISGAGLTIDCAGADCPKLEEKGNCEGPQCPIIGEEITIDCEGADCLKPQVQENCEGSDCPIVGAGLTIDCEGPDCPQLKGKGNCEGSDCPVSGAGFTIDCAGADCPKLEGKGNCEGPQCPIIGEEITIDCEGADCPKPQVQENCEGSDCPIVGAGLTIDCTGADCPKSQVQGNCDGADCPIVGADLTIDCEGADCPELKAKGNCEGPQCPIIGEELTIDCKGADCPKLEVSANCEGPNCPIVGKGVKTDCRGADCPKLKVNVDCEGLDCPFVGKEIIDCKGAKCPGAKEQVVCDGANCPSTIEDSDISCDGTDCSLNAEDTLKDCEGADCSKSGSAESPCAGPKCPKNTKLSCAGRKCPKETEGSTDTNNQNPMVTFCDHSDPHYKRKLKRLQKIRRIDSSTPRTWSAVFASPSPFDKKSNTSVEIKTINKNPVQNPLLRILGAPESKFLRHNNSISSPSKNHTTLGLQNQKHTSKVLPLPRRRSFERMKKFFSELGVKGTDKKSDESSTRTPGRINEVSKDRLKSHGGRIAIKTTFDEDELESEEEAIPNRKRVESVRRKVQSDPPNSKVTETQSGASGWWDASMKWIHGAVRRDSETPMSRSADLNSRRVSGRGANLPKVRDKGQTDEEEAARGRTGAQILS